MIFVPILIILLIFILIFSGINEIKKYYSQRNNMYKVLGIIKSDVKYNHKFLIVKGINTNINTKCTLIIHKDYLFIVLPSINYKISKDQLVDVSMFNNDILITKNNSESLAEHFINTAIYDEKTEAIRDALRPSTKTVKFKMNYMNINYNSNKGSTESIVLAPETYKDNNYIKLVVGLINTTYKLKPQAINPQAISSKTVEL